ncbi:hypothetical protein ACTFIR_008232 [Dictyostelium discoideum]
MKSKLQKSLNHRTSDEDYLKLIFFIFLLGHYYDLSVNGVEIEEMTEDESLLKSKSGSLQCILVKDKKKKRKLDNSTGNWKQNGEEKPIRDSITKDQGINQSNSPYVSSFQEITENFQVTKRTLTYQDNSNNNNTGNIFKLWEFSIQMAPNIFNANEILLRHYLNDDPTITTSIKYVMLPISSIVAIPKFPNSTSIVYPYQKSININSSKVIFELFLTMNQLNQSFKPHDNFIIDSKFNYKDNNNFNNNNSNSNKNNNNTINNFNNNFNNNNINSFNNNTQLGDPVNIVYSYNPCLSNVTSPFHYSQCSSLASSIDSSPRIFNLFSIDVLRSYTEKKRLKLNSSFDGTFNIGQSSSTSLNSSRNTSPLVPMEIIDCNEQSKPNNFLNCDKN